jgi:hypothetical protein
MCGPRRSAAAVTARALGCRGPEARSWVAARGETVTRPGRRGSTSGLQTTARAEAKQAGPRADAGRRRGGGCRLQRFGFKTKTGQNREKKEEIKRKRVFYF